MIASLDLVEGIEDCELVIVCDKMKIIEPDKKINWKSGKVNEESQSRYEHYIQNLREKYVKDNDSTTNRSSQSDNCADHATNPSSQSDTKCSQREATSGELVQEEHAIPNASFENGGMI